jgi:hypothetical protein
VPVRHPDTGRKVRRFGVGLPTLLDGIASYALTVVGGVDVT